MRSPDQSRRRHPLRRLLLVLALVFFGFAALAGYRVVSAARDLREVRDLVSSAGQALEEGHLGAAEAQLADAESLILRVNGTLYSNPELSLVTIVPGVAANLEELREAVGIGAELIVGGRRLLEAAAPLEGPDGQLEVPLASGAIPVEAVSRTADRAQDLLGALVTDDELERRRFILGPIRSLRDELARESDQRRSQLADLTRGLQIVADMAGGSGDRRYLIAVANTAEMRGSGGMMLDYGVLQSTAGDFELSAFGRVGEIALDAPLPADKETLPPDALARWGGTDIAQDWRSATLPADFSIVGPHLAAMYELRTGEHVDGVIQIDPSGLAAILEGIGPVTVPEVGAVDATNVEALTLNEAYVRFPGIDERSDVLGDIAEATFRKLVDGDYESLRPLGRAVLKSIAGRHIIMDATDGPTEEGLRYFQADGALPAPSSDHLHLTVQNVSGNKLDYYLDTGLTVSGTRDATGPGRLKVEISLRNGAPADATEPRYVFGPFADDMRAGEYLGIVTLYVPTATALDGMTGDAPATAPVTGTEGGQQFVSFTVRLPAQGAQTMVLDLVLPPRPAGPFRMVVVPSPRIRPTQLDVDLRVDDERVQRSGPLVATAVLATDGSSSGS